MTTHSHRHGTDAGTPAASPHGHGGGYAGYAVTWFYLLAITLLEVGIVEAKSLVGVDLPPVLRIGGLVSLTVLKAGLIMAYFMHLKFERPALLILLLVPLVMLVLLYVALIPDANTVRAVNPGMREGAGPGHAAPGQPPATTPRPRSGH
jgi:cytochrome c oxidase subunit 4